MNEQKQVDELAELIGQAIDHNSFLGDERMETINMQGIAKELIANGVVVQEWINIERLQEYYKLYFERERTIKELQENIEHLQNKIVMYEKEFDRLAWDSSPMGGFHDD